MKLTKVLAVAAMLLLGAFAAKAQPQGGFGQMMDPAQMVKMRVDHMKESLKLSDDQCKQLTALFTKQNEEMSKMMQQNQGGQPDFSAFQKMQDAQNAELKKILTEEQFKKNQEEMQRMMSGMGGGMGAPGAPQR